MGKGNEEMKRSDIGIIIFWFLILVGITWALFARALDPELAQVQISTEMRAGQWVDPVDISVTWDTEPGTEPARAGRDDDDLIEFKIKDGDAYRRFWFERAERGLIGVRWRPTSDHRWSLYETVELVEPSAPVHIDGE